MDSDPIIAELEFRRRCTYLNNLYGAQWKDLEVAMFEGTYSIVDEVDSLFRSSGFCLTDKTQTAKVYHAETKYKYLNKLFEQITSVVGLPDCQTREDILDMFPLPISPQSEILERSRFHAQILFNSFRKKLPAELDFPWHVRRYKFKSRIYQSAT